MVSIIVDDALLLRTYEMSDADELFNTVDRSRKHLHPWLDWVDNTTKPEHSARFIENSLYDVETQRALALGVFYAGILIGGVGMHHWEQSVKCAQIGYWISKEYEGKGIMHRCLRRFIDYLFSKIGLNKLEIHFFPANVQSAKVAERLGFRIEGVIRQSKLWHGRVDDIVIAGLLKSEWDQRAA